MFAILINEKGGEQKRLDFDKPEVTIGRVQGNDIILPKGNVSKRHSRIVLKDGKFIIVDLKSTNGTYVNGRKITSPLVVKSTDKIYIGDFILSIDEAAAGESQSSGAGPSVAPGPRAVPPPPPPRPPRQQQQTSAPDEKSGLEMPPPPDDQPEIGEEHSRPKAPPPSVPLRRGAPTAADVKPTMAAEVLAKPTVASNLVPMPPSPDKPDRQDRPDHQSSPPRPVPAPTSPLDQPVRVPDHVSEQPTRMAPAAQMMQTLVPQAPIQVQVPASLAPPPATAPAAAPAPTSAPAPLEPVKPTPIVRQQEKPAATQPVAPARQPLGKTTAPGPAPQRTQPRPMGRQTSMLAQIQTEDPQRRRRVDLLNQVVPKAIEQLGLQTLTAEHVADTSLAARVENAVGDLVGKLTPLPAGIDAEALIKESVAEILGAGPLDDLLADETVHDVAVTSHDRIFVDRGSGQTVSDKVFSGPLGVLRAVHRLALRAGAKLDGTLTELRLEGGALLQVALPPHARVPALVLRRSRKTGGRLQDLVDQKVLSAPMSEFLEVCMRERRNFVISGYGRGVMLGALGAATAAGARVVTVEPVSELDLSATTAAWIALIGRGADTRNVIGHAGRLHPDHLIITDVRGPEALDVTAALCGAQGVVVGVDAASARDAIARIESLGRLSGESPPRKALREELAQGLHLAVHVGKTAAGAYRVMEISEVTLAEEGGVELIPMFSFKQEGVDGQFVATGHVPAFAG